MITDLEFYIDYLVWGDNAIIKVLETINEDEYRQSLGDLAGSIATKAGHLVGIYEFFVSAINGDPYDHFPTLSDLSIDLTRLKFNHSFE